MIFTHFVIKIAGISQIAHLFFGTFWSHLNKNCKLRETIYLPVVFLCVHISHAYTDHVLASQRLMSFLFYYDWVLMIN